MSAEVTRVFVNKDCWKFRPFASENLTKRDGFKLEGLDVRLHITPQFCRRSSTWTNKTLCIIIDHPSDVAQTIAFAAVVRYRGKIVEKCSLATTIVRLPYRHNLECLSVKGFPDMIHTMEVTVYSVSMSPTACDFRQLTECRRVTLDRETVPESDFVVKAGDKVTFNAHHIILAAQSKYMRTLIYGPYVMSNELDWSHHSPAVVGAYLELLYNPLMGTDLDTVENLADLYALTDMTGDHHYQVRLALSKCFLKCEEIAPLVELFRTLTQYADTELVIGHVTSIVCLVSMLAPMTWTM